MMLLEILKSKVHGAKVTGRNLEYVGSIKIDASLVAAAGMLEHEKVLVSNLANGERFETYVILGKWGSGIVEVNGAAAKLAKKGDKLIIMSFAFMTDEEAKKHKPNVVILDEKNKGI